MARATTGKKATRKKLSKVKKTTDEQPEKVEDAEVVSDIEAEKLVEAAGSALDSAKEPEHDAEKALESKDKKTAFPYDVWENVCDRDIRLNIGRPIVVRPGDKVKIISSLRRSVRKKMGSKPDGTYNMSLVHSETIDHMLADDEKAGMEAGG